MSNTSVLDMEKWVRNVALATSAVVLYMFGNWYNSTNTDAGDLTFQRPATQSHQVLEARVRGGEVY